MTVQKKTQAQTPQANQQPQTNRAVFDVPGLLAIAPMAFGLEHRVVASGGGEPFQRAGSKAQIAVVHIDGPLAYKFGFPFDDYAAILNRVSTAFADEQIEAVVLRIDSPGGMVTGAFDTARTLRALRLSANKPLYVHVEGDATSAAYALASPADKIVVSETGTLGSIGVIWTGADVTSRNEKEGVKIHLVTSGDHKADGNPNTVLSDEAHAAIRQRVNETAEVFFELVASHRPALTTDTLRGLQANTFLGKAAKDKQLADAVQSWDAFIQSIDDTLNTNTTEGTMAKAEDEKESVRSALSKAADEGDDKAKRALAAYDASDEEKEGAKAEDEKEDTEATKAEGEDEEKEEEKEEASSKASASAFDVQAFARAQELAAENTALRSKLAKAEIAGLVASRPDLDTKLVGVLKGMTDPKQVQAILDATPKAAGFTSQAEQLASNPAQPRPDLTVNPLAAQMGMVQYQSGVEIQGNVQAFGVRKPVTAQPEKK